MINPYHCIFFVSLSLSLASQATTEQALARFTSITNPAAAKSRLGYDPCIQYIPDTTRSNNTINVYAHGWNENKEYNLRRSLYELPAIIYNFPDAREQQTAPLRQTSLGQYADIMPTIFVLNAIVESGIAHTIHLIGFSRGATTIINTIAVLNKPEGYQHSLLSIGVDRIRCKEILDAITRGIVLLDCPFKRTSNAIYIQVQKYRSRIITTSNYAMDGNNFFSVLNMIYHWSMRNLIATIDHISYLLVDYVLLPLYTNYAPWREQPIHSLDNWPAQSITTILRYDQCDPMVANDGDVEFYEKIHALNPMRTFLVTSNQCGHCGHCQDLVNLFHMIGKMGAMQPSHALYFF